MVRRQYTIRVGRVYSYATVAKVFISYRRSEPDHSVAKEIENYLVTRGVAVFRDAQIRIGEEWADSIDEHLASSRFLVLLISKASMESGSVREEIVRAHQRGLSILPIRLDSSELPYHVASIIGALQFRHLNHPAGLGLVCQEILEIIHGEQGGRRTAGSEQLQPETGTVSLDSPFYVRRDVDDRIEERLQGRGTTILLRGPRQVGKSSLLVRAAAAAENGGRRVSRIDFQLMENEHRRSLKTLLRHLAFSIASDLGTEAEPDQFWDDRLGAKISITRFVERAVLKPSKLPVVLCLDEVDSAFGTDYCGDFFAMLRVWHNERATSSAWSRLHLLIAHSTNPALWISDLDQSPFNVGEPHLLTDFSVAQVRDLCKRYGVDANAEELIDVFGGHPFLIRKALFTIYSTGCTVAELVAGVFDSDSPFRDHLQILLAPLLTNPALNQAMGQAVHKGSCESERAFQGLLGAGLVRGYSREAATPRCKLYRVFFSKRL